jgi:hypothetical protein
MAIMLLESDAQKKWPDDERSRNQTIGNVFFEVGKVPDGMTEHEYFLEGLAAYANSENNVENYKRVLDIFGYIPSYLKPEPEVIGRQLVRRFGKYDMPRLFAWDMKIKVKRWWSDDTYFERLIGEDFISKTLAHPEKKGKVPGYENPQKPSLVLEAEKYGIEQDEQIISGLRGFINASISPVYAAQAKEAFGNPGTYDDSKFCKVVIGEVLTHYRISPYRSVFASRNDDYYDKGKEFVEKEKLNTVQIPTESAL